MTAYVAARAASRSTPDEEQKLGGSTDALKLKFSTISRSEGTLRHIQQQENRYRYVISHYNTINCALPACLPICVFFAFLSLIP